MADSVAVGTVVERVGVALESRNLSASAPSLPTPRWLTDWLDGFLGVRSPLPRLKSKSTPSQLPVPLCVLVSLGKGGQGTVLSRKAEGLDRTLAGQGVASMSHALYYSRLTATLTPTHMEFNGHLPGRHSTLKHAQW